MNLIRFVLLISLMSNAFAMSLEDEKKYDELEGSAFLKALTSDKKFQDVVDQFSSVRKNESELGEIYFFLGNAYYELKEFQKANNALKKGERYKRPHHFYALWARVHYSLKNYNQCSEMFSKVSRNDFFPGDWKNYFICLEKSRYSKEVLHLALNQPPTNSEFFLESQKMLLKYELREEASQIRSTFLNNCRESDLYLGLWIEMERLKVNDPKVLEAAHACHPDKAEITSVLIKHLFQEGKYHSIAYLFDLMSTEDKVYVKHAAEFYKVAGRYVVADYFFSLGDENDYLMSRSAHFLGQENYAALLTVPFRPELQRKNKDLAYALAFSHFKYLSLRESKKLLAGEFLSGNQKQLLQLVEACQKLDWRCRP